MKKIILIFALSLASITPAHAVKVDLGFDLATTTQYPNCQGYVDQMIRLWELLAEKGEFLDKHPNVVGQIVDMLKKLNKAFIKCEKCKGKKAYDPTVNIGTTFDLDWGK